MAVDCFSFLKVKAVRNCTVIRVPFLDIRVTGSKMRGEEAEASVVVLKPHPNGTLITRHTTEARLATRLEWYLKQYMKRKHLPSRSFDMTHYTRQF